LSEGGRKDEDNWALRRAKILKARAEMVGANTTSIMNS